LYSQNPATAEAELAPALGSERPLEPTPSVGCTKPDIVLDLSRLISRMGFSAPTGVDRVEMAYATALLDLAPGRVSFAAGHPCGLYGRLRTEAAIAFLEDTKRMWRGDGRVGWRWTSRAAQLWRLRPQLRRPADSRPAGRVYLLVSPHHLDRPRRLRRILARERAGLVCLVHDLIPIEYPEYARPKGPAQHVRRMATVADLADGVIVTSAAVRRSFLTHVQPGGWTSPLIVAPLGVEPLATPPPRPDPPPQAAYFVMVGTIEPRKNHLLLLHLWRRMVEEFGAQAVPKLILVGRRGWENENILDLLDRCPALQGVVEEHGHVSDQQMRSLVRGARALLMPSFAEGFGLPIAEALQMGVPVLCSDIPAHHEVAGDVAEYLDPLDGPAWRRAILDYAVDGSARRADQIRRLAGWRAPSWRAHFAMALDLIDGVGQPNALSRSSARLRRRADATDIER
jgi:glycosyltransferase involved in cell wall biosynthesis